MTWLAALGFWQWAALTGLGLLACAVGLVGAYAWMTGRQTRAIRRQTANACQHAEQRDRDLKDRLEGEEEG